MGRLLAWATAALKCRPRDTWIAGPRPPMAAAPARGHECPVLSTPPTRPNLASRVLALTCRRLSADWAWAHGHPVLLAETFVDPTRFRGTCYLAAGWQCLGVTRGFAKRNMRYVRPWPPEDGLGPPAAPGGRRRPHRPVSPTLDWPEGGRADARCQSPTPGRRRRPAGSLAVVPDPRHRRGVRHPRPHRAGGRDLCRRRGGPEFHRHRQ